METVSVDHTAQLEKRISAIKIHEKDSCIFFKKRQDCLFSQKKCCYCAFASFERDFESSGLCKFKK